MEQIPEGMKFLKASQGGTFDPQKKTVTWNIQQIAGEESEDVSVMLLPEAPGTKESVIRVFGETGQIGSTTAETAIRGFALLDIKISLADQPVVIGERVSYRIEIQNRGTEAATGVLVSSLLPKEMKMISIKGPLEHQQTEQQIDFSPIADLAPNKHIAVDLLLEATAPGDTRLHVQVQSDQMKKPLSRETATVIFGEQNLNPPAQRHPHKNNSPLPLRGAGVRVFRTPSDILSRKSSRTRLNTHRGTRG